MSGKQQQQTINYAAVTAQRREDVLVCLRLHCRGAELKHWVLMEEVLRVAGGKDYRRSLIDLANLLWCSPPTVRRVIRDLERWGLLIVEEQRYVSQGQKENCYSLDWEGIAARKFGRRAASGGRQHDGGPPYQNDTPPCQSDRASPQNDTPSYQNDTPYKESSAFLVALKTTSSSGLVSPATSVGPAKHQASSLRSQASGPKPRPSPASAWQEVEEELFNFGQGVAAAGKACESARKQGAVPAFVSELVAYARRHAGEFKSPEGALFWRVRSAKPGQRVDEGWVGQADQRQREQRRAASEAAQAQQRHDASTLDRQRAASQRESQAVEERLGVILDGLPEAERREIARAALAGDDTLWGLYRRHGALPYSVQRRRILEHMGKDEGGRMKDESKTLSSLKSQASSLA